MPIEISLVLIAAGVLLVVGASVALRTAGARPSVARRLAGPPGMKVGQLLDADRLPGRAVRVTGRIRCRDPLDAGDGERLVAFHRDVEVRAGGRWRSIERLRETRSFDLWDHDGSVPVDPSLAAEPLIAIPKVWRGSPSELQEPHASACARLAERYGEISEARAVTRTINVTDRLLLLARPVAADGGHIRLEPPEGGYLLANLELDDAMRLLGGRHRRLAAASVIGRAAGLALAAVGAVGVAIGLLGGR